jgi:type IV pilus assembly protein PilY1
MKRIRALSFALAALTGVVAGLPLTIHADDTEIYVGNRAFDAGVRPNVLLILDTSGSMAANDGLALDRLDRVKVALNAILDEVTDMNIGLARFHTPGGPILFPISYVDSDVRDVEQGLIPEINQRLVGSANDAEQLGIGGATVLDSTQLEMTFTEAFGTEMSNVATVSQSADDASQASAISAVDTTSTAMNCCIGQNALRFQNIPIPPGSKVTRAILELKVSADATGATNIVIDGHQTGNSTAYDAAPDIFSRPRTPAAVSVNWTASEWVADSSELSPNLRRIVQAIVDDAGWATNNSLSLFVTGAGSRVAKTFDDGGTATAANLYLDWVEPPPPVSSGDQIIGLRFTDVRVPQSQGIRSAVIEFMPTEDAVNPVNLVVIGEKADDSAAFTTAINDISSRPPTLSNVPWNPPAVDWKEGKSSTARAGAAAMP